ncbi:MAG TPA: hypothetical protein VFS09_02090 [Candidatus Eisenbacteria bacterium]|nr:hypothetical protein [Candidatus Eisenbacteria bacterium]
MRPASATIRDNAGAVAATAILLALSLAAPARAEGDAPPEDKRLEIHGYGEIHYNNPETGTMDKDALARVDVHRLVLGWEYEFTSSIRMSAEVDFEHSATEIELEYALLEYDLTPTLSFRVGSLLLPVGPLNEFHEPPTYHSVERPYIETYVLPTTWQDIGLGLVGRTTNGALAYRAYVVSGLDATGFSTSDGIRGGRQHGVEAKAEDLGLVGRLEYAIKGGFTLGTSGYVGGADQGTPGLGSVDVTIFEGDLRFRRGAFDLRGEWAGVSIGNSDSVSIAVGEPVGSNIWGVTWEAAFDLINGRSKAPGRALWLFTRYERFDTNGDTEPGIARDPAAERKVFTTGVSYRPVREVALKTDVEFWKDGADQDLTRLNVGAAFQF